MVFLSSMGSKIVCPGLICYVAAKRFTSGIGRGLSRELKGKVDVIDYIPSYVKTNIIRGLGVPDPWTITPKRAAEVCFRDLGIDESSCCSFRHWIFHSVFLSVEHFDFIRYGSLKKMKLGFEKRMQRGKFLGSYEGQKLPENAAK